MRARSDSREIALQLLYYLDRVGGDREGEIERFWHLYPAEGEARSHADRLVRKTLEHDEELVRLISEASEHWSFQRMDAVTRCILRLGACEILFLPDIPPRVAIDEAVELTKRYGPASAAGFVNGVLDRLLREGTPA